MTTNELAQLLIAPALLSVLAGVGWVIRWYFSRADAKETAAAASRAEQNAFDRSLFTEEFSRLRAELQQVTPQLASLRKEYAESVAREVALMEQYRKLQYEATEERERLRRAIRSLHAEVRRLRSALEANGIRVPADPPNIRKLDPILDYETED